MRKRHADITLTKRLGDGAFMVAEIRRGEIESNPYFALGADIYASEAAFEAGNSNAIVSCGCLHEEILNAFPDIPELALIEALHLSDVKTGEPMHAVSNGWYGLGGGDMEHELSYHAQGRKNYYKAPDPYPEDGGRPGEDFIFFFWGMAARALRCSLAELPIYLYGDPLGKRKFGRWVDEIMRPRWQAEADRANAWIDAHTNSVEIPAEQTREAKFVLDLEGLHVTARHTGKAKADYVSYPAWVNTYAVTVKANGHQHRFKFFGSIADYQDGILNARKAAFGILKELAEFEYQSAEELARDMGDDDPDFLSRMKALEKKADNLMPGLSANLEVIGG